MAVQIDLLTLPLLLLAAILLVLLGILLFTDRRPIPPPDASDVQRLGTALVVAGVLTLTLTGPALLAWNDLHRGWVVTGGLLALLGTILQAVEVLSHPGR